ncbi:hypothetical protein BGW36DRAFT_387097 [Talaromyces proteolyticus]|uniref:Uncharacterized protein n=1 Tax=Talaromyces proteolyticus TaxID=1131652 RepID=A0AAD4KNR8_9EURO|nr:uncharacterized protein BGW36DRAFT_387097 [Talaromyces proteolyticus]KAH8692150.1 hypothetical protein BGW36DRAFT_387097 [Talaromyces proteolyticus]
MQLVDSQQHGPDCSASSLSIQNSRTTKLPYSESDIKPLSRLQASNLPSKKALITQPLDGYFANVHPLRCFGFVHIPTLLAQFDKDISEESDHCALLLSICALGANILSSTKFCTIFGKCMGEPQDECGSC